MRIRFLEVAEIELDEAVQHYNHEAVGLGDVFLAELLSALDAGLQIHPAIKAEREKAVIRDNIWRNG